MRRLRSTYEGSILRIRRSSDSAEQDIGYTATGDLDAAAAATFIGGGSGYIVNWYDQSGNAYTATQATPANQPLYVASGQNGRPVGRWDGVNDGLDFTLGAFNSPMSVQVALYFAKLNSTANEYPFYLGAGGAPNTVASIARLGPGGNANKYSLFDGSTALTGPVLVGQVWKLLFQEINTSSVFHKLWINSVSQTVPDNDASINTSGNGGIGYARFYGSLWSACDIAELVICNTALSTADRQAAEAAANNYFAIY